MPEAHRDRVPLVGGNWKMDTDAVSSSALAGAVAERCGAQNGPCEVAIFPPFPYLWHAAEAIGDVGLILGAQDLSDRDAGAFTGQVSGAMLVDLGIDMVLVGHSERRHVLGEEDVLVNAKLHAALRAGIRPVLCVGETTSQRREGQAVAVVESQVRAGLADVEVAAMRGLVVAYEPVWAIGTGDTATPGDAESMHAAIRTVTADLYDEDVGAELRILYGGSVNPGNAGALFDRPGVDGGLVGGASLDARAFADIVHAAVVSTGPGEPLQP